MIFSGYTKNSFTIYLTLGTTYEFTGTWSRSVGYNYPCEYTCFHEEDIEPLTYDTVDQASLGRWSRATTSTGPDTVWVRATPSVVNRDPNGCGAYPCFGEGVELVADPCPLAIRNVRTVVGGCPSVGGAEPTASWEVALVPDVVYTFGGLYIASALAPPCDPYLNDTVCYYMERFAQVAYSSSPTATRETTWGRVKAIYR